jgi:hypothetical protein
MMSKKPAEIGERIGERIVQAMEDSLVAMIRKGDWILPAYESRIKVNMSTLRIVYDGIDMNRVLRLVQGKVEEHVADKILASLATELATDVKQVMTNRELREDVRAVIRSKFRELAAATHEKEG